MENAHKVDPDQTTMHCLPRLIHVCPKTSNQYCTYGMILSFRTDKSEQTVQTQIRLLLEEQSDQGLHCLLFHWHLLDEIPLGLALLSEFPLDNSKVFWLPKTYEFYGSSTLISPLGLQTGIKSSKCLSVLAKSPSS